MTLTFFKCTHVSFLCKCGCLFVCVYMCVCVCGTRVLVRVGVSGSGMSPRVPSGCLVRFCFSFCQVREYGTRFRRKKVCHVAVSRVTVD